MILPDGSIFPNDYAPPLTRNGYTIDGELRRPVSVEINGVARLIYAYEDHPVVRAYAVLSRTADMRKRTDRETYLAFIAVAVPMDDYGVISGERAAKITTALQEYNRMDDLETLLARLDQAELRQDRVEGELNDDARAQGDAAARVGHGMLTVEVARE
jgi:hypothetical protein